MIEGDGIPVTTGVVYGPGATAARARAVDAVVRAVGIAGELLAAHTPAENAVVLGAPEHVAPLAAPHGILVVEDRGGYAVAPVPRALLADRLDATGRADDAAKVRGGPPDQPAPEGARLLVVAIEGIVWVTWSHPGGGSVVVGDDEGEFDHV